MLVIDPMPQSIITEKFQFSCPSLNDEIIEHALVVVCHDWSYSYSTYKLKKRTHSRLLFSENDIEDRYILVKNQELYSFSSTMQELQWRIYESKYCFKNSKMYALHCICISAWWMKFPLIWYVSFSYWLKNHWLTVCR